MLLLVAGLAAAGLFAAGLGLASTGAKSTKLSAKLTARAETPRPKGAATAAGAFTATLTGSSLAWKLTFSKLSGKAMAAHIHIGRAGVAGPVAVPLCGPCASGAHGTARLTSKTKTALLAGKAYVNVHTAKNAAGEIRGQIAGGTAAGTGGAGTTTDSSGTTTDDSGGGGTPGYG